MYWTLALKPLPYKYMHPGDPANGVAGLGASLEMEAKSRLRGTGIV